MAVPSDSSSPIERDDLLEPVDLTGIDPADLLTLCSPVLQRALKRAVDPGTEECSAGFQSAL
jgi:FXSXX-COOH protein